MCMDNDKTISDEELWGVPPEDLPKPDLDRNHFDEQQPIKKPKKGKND